VAEPLSRRADRGIEVPAGDPEPLDEEAHSRAVAEYLTDMIEQLESISRRGGLDLLAYLLSMARVEAETNARAGGHRR
jgi:hypothetical protein